MILGVLIAAGVFAHQIGTPGQDGSLRPAVSPDAAVSSDAVRPDVIYQVIFMADGEYLKTPTVLGQFGREVRVEVPNLMRVVMITEEPDADGRSYTSAKMSIFKDNVWQPAREMSMNAYLAYTPAFEYSMEGTPYRFVIMPRLVVPAAD
jgi:hypothetical protein